ncbi:flagellar basal body-associated protein FliL [Priestia abyssalis]|uniref:flagellar basal body-associated protein FliL n=1 Tax=Priestia abyssalis TaxID=1221450 RepID=UPI001116CBA9|nr:flagellar basal body-associated protein FliL [Priestia abyssalis]
MFKNKLVSIMLIILMVLALVGAVAAIVVLKLTNNNQVKEPSAKEVVEATVQIDEITTNLSNDQFIRIAFSIQTDSKKAKEELEMRDFQVRDIIVKDLSDMKAEQFKGRQGLSELEERLKVKINKLMQEGKVVKVYTTSKMLQ